MLPACGKPVRTRPSRAFAQSAKEPIAAKMGSRMRTMITLMIVLFAAAGLVGGAILIGYARLQKSALPASTGPAPISQLAPSPTPVRSLAVPAPIAKTEPKPASVQTPEPPARIHPASAPAPTDGSIILLPAAGRIHGYKLKFQNQPNPVIRYWVD